jgi:hypothetical protein
MLPPGLVVETTSARSSFHHLVGTREIARMLLRQEAERAQKKNVHKVMHEHKEGKLKSGSGKKVRSRKQAIRHRDVGIRAI